MSNFVVGPNEAEYVKRVPSHFSLTWVSQPSMYYFSDVNGNRTFMLGIKGLSEYVFGDILVPLFDQLINGDDLFHRLSGVAYLI